MFRKIDPSSDIELILDTMRSNMLSAQKIQQEIRSLNGESSKNIVIEDSLSSTQRVSSFNNYSECDEIDEEYTKYLHDYSNFFGESIAELSSILPSREDYHYEDILLRLHAESLKVIAYNMKCKYNDPSVADIADEFIQFEKKKIEMLKKLLLMEEDVSDEKSEENQIVLVPNHSGDIFAFSDLKYVPIEYFPEVYELLGTIIKGTFKRKRNFKAGTNNALVGGVCEVRGTKTRVLFRRINKNTYAVFSIFVKKTNNDRGYQEFLKNCMGRYREVEDFLKEKVEDLQFMELNNQSLLDLWNVLGYSEAPKQFRKDSNS